MVRIKTVTGTTETNKPKIIKFFVAGYLSCKSMANLQIYKNEFRRNNGAVENKGSM
jgi:hypothetical protein